MSRSATGRTWSATFDSYDERNDDVYYVVTLSGGDATFMAQVSAALSTDEWVEPEATHTLRARIGQVAATGQTNASDRGAVLRAD